MQKQGPSAWPRHTYPKMASNGPAFSQGLIFLLSVFITNFFIRSLTPASFIPNPQALASGCCFKAFSQASLGSQPYATSSRGWGRTHPSNSFLGLPWLLPARLTFSSPSGLHLLLCPASLSSHRIPSLSSMSTSSTMSPESPATEIATIPRVCWPLCTGSLQTSQSLPAQN